jgi:hypothetical protein
MEVQMKKRASSKVTPYAKKKMVDTQNFDLYDHVRHMRILLLDESKEPLIEFDTKVRVRANDTVTVKMPWVELA